MGGSNQFNTSMHMFSKESEGFDVEDSDLEQSEAKKIPE